MDIDDDWDDGISMIIQLPLDGFWGSEAQDDLRQQLADSFDRLFTTNGLATFDGTDFGSGTMNLFIVDIDPANWGSAFEVALVELRRVGLAGRAIVVKCLPEGREDDDDEDDYAQKHVVVWPLDFQGEFSLF